MLALGIDAMDQAEQIRIMEKQLSNFDTLMEQMQYMSMFFDPDPMFTKGARDLVRSNIARALSDAERSVCKA